MTLIHNGDEGSVQQVWGDSAQDVWGNLAIKSGVHVKSKYTQDGGHRLNSKFETQYLSLACSMSRSGINFIYIYGTYSCYNMKE